MKFSTVILALFLLVPTQLDVAEAQDTYLTFEMLGEFLKTEKNMKWQSARGGLQGASRYRPDGSVLTAWNDQSRSGSDAGHWRIDGDLLCIKYQRVHSGRESCYKLKKTGSNNYLAVDMEGNPAFTNLVD